MDRRSSLAKAKGWGATGEGSHHWWLQRLTAVALVPLVVWFVAQVLRASEVGHFFHILASPVQTVIFTLFLGVALYHGALGMRVVIEDYVRCKVSKFVMLLIVNFGTIGLAVASGIALMTAHISGGHVGYHKDRGAHCYTAKTNQWEQGGCHRKGAI